MWHQAFDHMTENPSSSRRVVELFYFDAGGGHRSAMTAVREILTRKCPDWTVNPVNLQKLLEPVDPMYLASGMSSEQFYNSAIRKGWTRGSTTFLRGLQHGIRIHAPVLGRQLLKHWDSHQPSVVVSLVPNFNAVMFRALRRIHPHVPYVTIMTDLADSPPHFWQEPQDQYIVCGSNKAALQAHLTGWFRPERIIKTSGMILKSSFYTHSSSPSLTREALGLHPQRPTALIMFGGNGSRISHDIISHIARSGLDVQTIVMCGHDEKLRRKLGSQPGCHAVPFTDRVADYMRLADFFIGKPGPGSISEAIHMGLPVIVENNARTMIQERYNVTWLEENGVGLGIESFADIAKAIRYLLHSNTLEKYQEHTHSFNNLALFEIPQILRSILDDGRGAVPNARHFDLTHPAGVLHSGFEQTFEVLCATAAENQLRLSS
jgi:UDP-N-acetylglucosamine:LPS N-acetylglucosamine transferase